MIFVSAILIIFILGMYEDLYTVLKISNKDTMIALLLSKWFLIGSIIAYNYFKIKRVDIQEIKNEVEKEPTTWIPKKRVVKQTQNSEQLYTNKHQDILKKKKLKTKSDVILAKYMDK